MKKFFLPVFIVLLAAGCGKVSVQTPQPQPGPVACTDDAKQCPDGSYVNRVAPSCDFAACPTPDTSGNPPVACPMIAKQCPDGSYVHPEGPKCEIPACPSASSINSGIEGQITIGPTCPVERIPPDPACADKAYEATVIVKSADGQKEVTRFTSSASGSFKVDLPPGNYLLVPVSPNVYPRAGSQPVSVSKNLYTHIDISYDSGIR